MKTLKEAVKKEEENRESRKDEDYASFRMMFAALALPPKDLGTEVVNDFLGNDGIDLQHEIAGKTIHLLYYAAGKDRILFIVCDPIGFTVKYEDYGSGTLSLEEALKVIAAWYLNLVEKYS